MDGARKLGLGILGELLLVLIDEDLLDLGIHGGLSFAFVLRLAEIVQILLDGDNSDIVFLFSESPSNSSVVFEGGIELDSTVEALEAIVGGAVSRRFANFVDVIERGVKGEGAINQVIGAIVIGSFALKGIKTAFLAAASNAHGDEAGNDHHGKEANEAAGDGSIEVLVVSHDET